MLSEPRRNPMKKFAKLLGYDPAKKQTNVRTELIAGIVTFLAMSYILTVNPNQIFGSTASPYWSSAFSAQLSSEFLSV